MTLWFTRRTGDGRRATYVLEGVGVLVALTLVAALLSVAAFFGLL